MEIDEEGAQKVVPFQLQFDKPLPFQIKIAEWNPEKDLLAMVTEDSKILLHRFNWQRLWTVSPGKCITSLCWRPDGKAIAVGLEDGMISLHDVENGKLLRSIKSHSVAVVCLNWEEDGTNDKDDCGNVSTYEDRTCRFFPPAPRAPRMPGVVAGDTGFMDASEDSSQDLSNSSLQKFNILCSGDKEGSICFSIFGIFSIGKLNIHRFSLSNELVNNRIPCRLLNASILKVALAKDLCHLTVICTGELLEDGFESSHTLPGSGLHGLHCLVLDTSIFRKRKNELHQVAQQASNIEDLTEVIRTSLSVMCKQWSDAMHTFQEKFDSLSTLIVDHGLDSTPEDEFLSLLGGARTSPPLHQFLVNSLGEAGLKRVEKVVCGAGKELQLIVLDHLQPAAEIIAFRMGELRGLSKWRSRFQGIGLDEKLINNATEKAGMLIIQVERFMKVLSTVEQQFSNFFNWLLKSTKMLMSQSSDQLLACNSELVIIFLKFLYNQDPVRLLLEQSEADHTIEIDMETRKRVKGLVQFGGFLDTEYLKRTLAKEFQQMEVCVEEAFQVPFTTISKKIIFQDFLPLFPLASSPKSPSSSFPSSISYYQPRVVKEINTSRWSNKASIDDFLYSRARYEDSEGSTYQSHEQNLVDYISFKIPDESFNIQNCVGIIRGFMHDLNSVKKGSTSLEAVIVSLPEGYHCVDLCLYKESQIVLLLNESAQSSESSGSAVMIMVQSSDLPFESISRLSGLSHWNLHELKDSIFSLIMENEKVRIIPHSVSVPLAVSASRGVACVFAARRRVLVYILEEDEDEVSDME